MRAGTTGYLEEDAERATSDRNNREALVEFLRKAGERVVELYGIWDGNFSDAPKVQESIKVERILDSDFCFKEPGFYKVAV